MTTEWIDYLFEDLDSGEQFFVEVKKHANSRKEAVNIAKQYFVLPKCLGTVDAETAEAWGLDTY